MSEKPGGPRRQSSQSATWRSRLSACIRPRRGAQQRERPSTAHCVERAVNISRSQSIDLDFGRDLLHREVRHKHLDKGRRLAAPNASDVLEARVLIQTLRVPSDVQSQRCDKRFVLLACACCMTATFALRTAAANCGFNGSRSSTKRSNEDPPASADLLNHIVLVTRVVS